MRVRSRSVDVTHPVENSWFLLTKPFLKGAPDAGGLVSYGPELHAHFKRLAAYVDKVVKGGPPTSLWNRPTKFELVINFKTAKALGLTIPQSLLQRADQVIE
jgi:putative ABC transport system substrate-binding protein